MDLALNNLQRLIYYKTPTTNNLMLSGAEYEVTVANEK